MKQIQNKIITFMLLISFLINIIPLKEVKAFDGNGNLPYDIGQDDFGNLLIVATAKTATSGIHWETAGFNITTSEIPSTTMDGLNGYKSVNSAAGSTYQISFESADVKKGDDVNSDGSTTTNFTFSKTQVLEALEDKGANITQGTTLYFHTIFNVYTFDENGNKVYVEKGIDNWKDIVTDQNWASPEDFDNYFNMQYTIGGDTSQNPETNSLILETEGGTTLTRSIIDSQYMGETVSWSNPATYPSTEPKYDLVGIYICNASTGSELFRESCKVGESSSFKTSYTEPLGGLAIHLRYRLRAAQEEDNSPTPPTLPIEIPEREPKPIFVPEAKTVEKSMVTPIVSGFIRADVRGGERFDVRKGIPTTESLYTQVNATKYLMGYRLSKKVGIETYAVKATKTYILKWEGKNASGTIDLTDEVKVVQVVNIRRAYGYWEIENFDLYQLGSATINNYALPGGSTTMMPSGYSAPGASASHTSSKDSHIIVPAEITEGIELPSITLSGTTEKPEIPEEDFTNEVDWQIPELTVQNDRLVVNGSTIMSTSPSKLEGPDINETTLSSIYAAGIPQCGDNVYYKPDQVIAATKKNGTYHTTGELTYSRVESVNSSRNSTIQCNILNLDNVVIHTPVYCEAIVDANNNNYVQLINPSPAIQAVLDPNPSLNDFTVNISNYGQHSNKQGYYKRDFSRSLRDTNVSYIASNNQLLRNEIIFPFDVFIQTDTGNEFIKNNTWILLDKNTITFHLPMWVQEGIYNVVCRSVAVNAENSKLDETLEHTANRSLYNYVATDTFKMEVSGRIYGLSIYDITDYPIWQEVFRVKNSLDFKINKRAKYPNGIDKLIFSKGYSYDYTVGTNDQYGNDTGRNEKYTFPLVNGSHPLYKNIGILKTGYAIRFKLDTIGSMYSNNSQIHIKPSFYFVDKEGKNRTAVDLYYEETINGKNQKLVKMGNALDKTNMKYLETGSPYTGIPTLEMKNTALILNMPFSKFIARRDSMFTFKDIRISSIFRTFVNSGYCKSILTSQQYSKIQAAGVTQAMIMKQMQRWYGSYYIPGIVNAAPHGFNVYDYASKHGINFKEDFWKKDGYIIVNMDIVTVDANGNERLSYLNATNYLNNGNMSMWVTEGAPLSKTDNKGTKFNFKAGDFIIYYVDKSVQDDYTPGGIY